MVIKKNESNQPENFFAPPKETLNPIVRTDPISVRKQPGKNSGLYGINKNIIIIISLFTILTLALVYFVAGQKSKEITSNTNFATTLGLATGKQLPTPVTERLCESTMLASFPEINQDDEKRAFIIACVGNTRQPDFLDDSEDLSTN